MPHNRRLPRQTIGQKTPACLGNHEPIIKPRLHRVMGYFYQTLTRGDQRLSARPGKHGQGLMGLRHIMGAEKLGALLGCHDR